MVRVIVIGTGSIGMRHLGVLRSMPGIEVSAVPMRAGRAAELRGTGIQAFDDLPAALASRPDGAIVATDTGRHVSDALACLGAGCEVLVEKPLASNASDGHTVAARARTLGLRVSVACCLRFDAALSWTRARLPDIGRVTLADFECLSWLPDWRPGRDHRAGYAARPGEGGVLLDLVHELDAAAWLFGPAATVHAVLENSGAVDLPAGIEDTALLLTTHAGGLAVTTRLGFASRIASRRLRVWGDRGLLEWDGISRRARQVDPTGREVAALASPGPDAMYGAQAEAWIGSLGGHAPAPLATLEEGIAVLATCDAARRSARTPTPVAAA